MIHFKVILHQLSLTFLWKQWIKKFYHTLKTVRLHLTAFNCFTEAEEFDLLDKSRADGVTHTQARGMQVLEFHSTE